MAEEGIAMDYAQMKQEKEARYKVYCETYAEQLRLQGYIDSLEKDNEHNRLTTTTTRRGARMVKKFIKINDKDIKRYKKALSFLPPLPEFK